ncbi:AraC family transcriptional regulator [Labrys miyagiensis]|uniref:AraC family transcriptional regulator n=1 Tax=Labrys miyagiensis TaxID=346912 RepID=A0ABQ6CLF8_9HYPH|nr:GlxA family transcriptional regulator [Labrys miyagiensis]GLS19559.1 AraC family transcriptional regulator [Labrys miyagiensis]
MTSDSGQAEIFAFLLVPGFSMMSLASAIEPLRSLNRLARKQAYGWRLCGLEAGEVLASNSLPFAVVDHAEALADAAYVFVCGGLRIDEAEERRYLSILRQAARRGLAIGAISTGPYLLARAGLLNGYRCTIHWENRSAFQEDFPDLDCTNKLYEIDQRRMTCSGGTAAMDMMLHLIANRHGADLARGVANQFHHERIRDQREDQRGGRLENLAFLPDKVRQTITLMQRQIENPVTLPGIARKVGVSPRQLERLFLQHTRMTPLRYYMQIRVERARELLLYSDRSVIDIAVTTGFTSTSHFATWYRRVYGSRPSDMRGRGRMSA